MRCLRKSCLYLHERPTVLLQSMRQNGLTILHEHSKEQLVLRQHRPYFLLVLAENELFQLLVLAWEQHSVIVTSVSMERGSRVGIKLGSEKGRFETVDMVRQVKTRHGMRNENPHKRRTLRMFLVKCSPMMWEVPLPVAISIG